MVGRGVNVGVEMGLATVGLWGEPEASSSSGGSPMMTRKTIKTNSPPHVHHTQAGCFRWGEALGLRRRAATSLRDWSALTLWRTLASLRAWSE